MPLAWPLNRRRRRALRALFLAALPDDRVAELGKDRITSSDLAGTPGEREDPGEHVVRPNRLGEDTGSRIKNTIFQRISLGGVFRNVCEGQLRRSLFAAGGTHFRQAERGQPGAGVEPCPSDQLGRVDWQTGLAVVRRPQ